MYENKFKTQNEFSTDVYYKIPMYHIPQLLCEMKSYSCQELLFNCLSPLSTIVFRVYFDSNTWEVIWKILSETYGSASRKRPSRFPENIKELKQLVTDFQTKHVEFVAEIASCKASYILFDDGLSQREGNNPYIYKHDCRSCDATIRTTTVSKDDSLVFTIFKDGVKKPIKCVEQAQLKYDLDRKFHTEITNSHP